MTKQEALAMAETKWWQACTAEQIVAFQLFEDLLCCPFNTFHEAIEKVLGRPVWTHEFGLNVKGLQDEFRKLRPPATMQEIMALIPKDKKVIVAIIEEE